MVYTTRSRSDILRYSYGHVEDMLKIHVIDKRIRVTDFPKMTKMYSIMILNLHGA